jgi:peptidoglycan hydrolase CwlO-like protein
MDRKSLISWMLHIAVLIVGGFVAYYGTVIDKSIAETKYIIEKVSENVQDHEKRLTTVEANEKNGAAQLQKIENHLLRIEDKLDRRLP